MAAVLRVLILGMCMVMVESSSCQPGPPPDHGLLNCENRDGELVCHATCKEGFIFPNNEKTVVKTCDVNTRRWEDGSVFHNCVENCTMSLVTDITKGGNITASSVYLKNELFGPEMARFKHENTVWRPETDDLMQYLQISFNTTYRFTAVVTKGDNVDTFVSMYRMLFSMDGVTWFPYKDPDVNDRFFMGNINSFSIHTEELPCPHIARYVRLNPLKWENHIALKLDLLGCPYNKDIASSASPSDILSSASPSAVKCKPIPPHSHGITSCEIQGKQVVCTFTCQKGYTFDTKDKVPAVVTRTCDISSGLYHVGDIPRCIERKSTAPAKANISGYCIEGPEDCISLRNGDYQFCGDCHVYATCAEHVFYVRACAAYLKFDSRAGLCDYRSNTCGVKSRRQLVVDNRNYSMS